MMGYVEAPKAWGLTRGMARVLGVSLTDAVVDGWLTRGELAALVDRCQTCGRDAQCSLWLGKVTQAAELPAFCANKAALQSLAGGA